MKPFADALGPDDAQHYEQIAAGEWYVEEQDELGAWSADIPLSAATAYSSNTETPEEKLGCALYHLAKRWGWTRNRRGR